MSRAASRISAMSNPSVHRAMVATATRPNSSLTKGPIVPAGSLGARSSIRLRTFCQIAPTSSYSSAVSA